MKRTLNYLTICLVLTNLFLNPAGLFAEENNEIGAAFKIVNPNPFSGILVNTGNCFIGENLLYQSIGIAGATGFIYYGIDKIAHDYFATHNWHEGISMPTPYLGYVFPVILGGGLYGFGHAYDDSKAVRAGSAALQATLISSVYIAALKAFTGRTNPDNDAIGTYEESKNFQFGFMNNGIHYGWPSGHMAVNTAAIVSLACVYNDKDWIKYAGGLYLGYMLFGVISHENGTMHWLSDAVAGTLIGYAIGSSVGKGYNANGEEENMVIAPRFSGNYQGISISYRF